MTNFPYFADADHSPADIDADDIFLAEFSGEAAADAIKEYFTE